MIKIITMLTALLPLVVQGQEFVINAAEVVGFGIFQSSKLTRRKGFSDHSPAADSVENVQFLNITSKIPATLGLDFGLEYVINTRPRGRPIEVTTIIKFPEPGLVRPNGKIYLESRETYKTVVGEPALHGYGFDESWEMVTGEWVFEVWHKKARLVSKRFTVVSDK
ncbi:MAG: DUF3859 domain-containing protein [bacterium]|nr:DUF3859 domain-containing protein [Gammaproteobacteria bacterium]HIL96171.1 DUF3859 domain-containing protein [Pseudomonadales bacterium]